MNNSKINYNFGPLVTYCDELLHYQSNSVKRSNILDDIKDELNRFFKDNKCIDVIYTDNDRMFFGMYTIPVSDKDKSAYIIEVDSKLLNPMMQLNGRELTAIFLHEIGHCVADKVAYNKIDAAANVFIAKEGIRIDNDYKQNFKNIEYIIRIKCIRNIASIFVSNNMEEMFADDFVRSAGFGLDLERAFTKFKRYCYELPKQRELSSLFWYLKMVGNFATRSGYAKSQLKEGKSVESSKFLRKIYDEAITEIVSMELRDGKLSRYTEAAINAFDRKIESLNEGSKDIVKSIRYNMTRDIQDKIYELEIRSKHLDNEYEAINLIKEINLYIDAMELTMGKNKLDKRENDMLADCLKKAMSLRDKVANLPTFKRKVYGLYIKYPEDESFDIAY